jgi:predicted permease
VTDALGEFWTDTWDDIGEGMMMTGLWSDLRFAVRGLLRAPAFTATTVTTVALGIGAVTAIFTVLNGVLLEPLPFEDPDQLVVVRHRAPGWGYEDWSVALSQFVTYEAENRVFDGLGAYVPFRASVTGGGEAERVPSVQTSWELLHVLGVRPSMGRLFIESDDQPGAPEVVLLSEGYWQRRFGGDPDALGATLQVDGRPHTIVGVLPPDFDMPGEVPSVLTPIRLPREARFRGYSYTLIGRLSPRVSIADATGDVDRMIPVATERYGGTSPSELEAAGFAANVRPLKQEYVGDIASTLWILLGSVLIVLAIAVANASNLTLVRAESRRREVALRAAIGARGTQLTRRFLFEGGTLGALGGLFGIGIAIAGVRLLLSVAPDSLPRIGEIAVDAQVVGVALALALATGLVLTIIPMLRTRSAGMMTSLNEGGRGSLTGLRQHRAQSALVVVQVSMALVLLVVSGLMLRSFVALQNVEPGFGDPGNVVTFRLNVPENEVPGAAAVAGVYESLTTRLEQINGIESVGAASSLTMEGLAYDEAVSFEDQPRSADEEPVQPRSKWVGAGYFEAMDIPILAGRTIQWSEIREGTPLVVVSRRFAEAHWGDPEAALGRLIARGALELRVAGALAGRLGGPTWHEIVGVVGDLHDDGLDRPAPEVVFWPVPVAGFIVPREMSFAVRTSRPSPLSVFPEIRAAIADMNPNLPVFGGGTLEQILERSMARTSFTLLTLLVAGAVALALGLIGIYGVISYVVSQRTREIGVRIALGATGSAVAGMVVKQGAILAGIGIAIGLVAATGLTRLMTSLLYGVEATDPLTFTTTAGLLMVVAVTASYLPALRAARTDPLEALRSE